LTIGEELPRWRRQDRTIDFSLVDISTKIGGCRQSVFSKGSGLTTVVVWEEYNAPINQNVRTYDPVDVKTHYAVIYA
jgi:hypothetical protein